MRFRPAFLHGSVTLTLALILSACGENGAPLEEVASCGEGEKACGGSCVSVTDPEFGCSATSSCTPCNEHEGVSHLSEEYTCSSVGECELVSCGSAVIADCDSDSSNGCETSVASDVDNCGACGFTCATGEFPGATDVFCQAGQCAPRCTPGRSDVDGDLENGCEAVHPFTKDEDCPAGIPKEWAPCSNVGVCTYFTPDSPCVSTHYCHFRGIGDIYWVDRGEHCDGRASGDYCESGTECASGGCDDGECLHSIGHRCTIDDQCSSAACCPTTAVDEFECKTRCVLFEVGDSCTWGAQCKTGVCSNGQCGDCATADCTAEFCGAQECGTVAGIDCGSCASGSYCTEAGTCEDPCLTVECGSWEGIDCGTCAGTDYCTSAGACEDACAGRVCGINEGVDCGTCSGTDYCTAAGACEDACALVDCGDSHGIDCGGCSGTDYCTTAGACEDACSGRVCGENEGVDCGSCASDKVCDAAGLCVDPVCPPALDFYCKGGHVYSCAGGLSEQIRALCDPNFHYCVDGESSCTRYLCKAGQDFCDGDSFSTCDSTRLAALPGAEDCAAQGMECSAAGCGDVTREWAGRRWVCDSTYQFVGSIYSVSTSTTLARFTQVIEGNSGSGSYHYTVHEGTSPTGPFTEIARADVALAAGLGFPFQDLWSPPIGVPLVAGRYYLLGVETTDNALDLCYTTVAESTPLSFGGSLGTGYRLPAPSSNITDAPLDGAVRQYVETVQLP